jgi:hypothetical protein
MVRLYRLLHPLWEAAEPLLRLFMSSICSYCLVHRRPAVSRGAGRRPLRRYLGSRLHVSHPDRRKSVRRLEYTSDVMELSPETAGHCFALQSVRGAILWSDALDRNMCIFVFEVTNYSSSSG